MESDWKSLGSEAAVQPAAPVVEGMVYVPDGPFLRESRADDHPLFLDVVEAELMERATKISSSVPMVPPSASLDCHTASQFPALSVVNCG